MSEDQKPDYAALNKQWAKELMENSAAQEYCNPYSAFSFKYFCEAYARTKSYGLQWGEMYQRLNEKKQNEWIDAGYTHLCIIQQKKLFDAQCLWRADQLDIKEIEVCFDFLVWEKDVLNCPFIEDITEQEVDWYCQYLSQNNVDLKQGLLSNWQDYENIKEAYATDNGNRNVPEWYDFHNGKTGNGILLILPDLRGQREKFYANLAREAMRRENPPPPPRDPELDKPWMNFMETNLHLELAKQIEDKHTFRLMQEYVTATEHHQSYEYERAQEDFRYLSEIKDELVPIESHYDYRQALSRAVENYKCRKIAEHLYSAFRKYKQMRYMGFQLGTEVEKEQFKSFTDLGKPGKNFILKGREENGEPRDFNF